MSATNVFTFELHQLTQPGKDLLAFAQKHPVLFGLLSVVIVAGIVTIVVPLTVGFGGTGVLAGSAAAAWQAAIGNVVAGSFFAMLQSLAASGTLVAVGGSLIGVGVAGMAGGAAWTKHVEGWAKSVDWATAEESVGKEWNKSIEWAKGIDWAGYTDTVNKGVGWAKNFIWGPKNG